MHLKGILIPTRYVCSETPVKYLKKEFSYSSLILDAISVVLFPMFSNQDRIL